MILHNKSRKFLDLIVQYCIPEQSRCTSNSKYNEHYNHLYNDFVKVFAALGKLVCWFLLFLSFSTFDVWVELPCGEIWRIGKLS